MLLLNSKEEGLDQLLNLFVGEKLFVRVDCVIVVLFMATGNLFLNWEWVEAPLTGVYGMDAGKNSPFAKQGFTLWLHFFRDGIFCLD